MPDHPKRQQEDPGRHRGQHNERDVDGAMQFLPAAAVLAGGEVMLVVFAHFGREARDVIPPSGQNLAYEGVDALTHTFMTTGGSAPRARSVMPASRGCGATYDGARAPFPPLSGLSRDGYCARRDVPTPRR